MKLCKKIGLCLLAVAAVLLCAIALPTTAQAADMSDLQFKLNDTGDGYIVSGCDESATGELIIPATYNGLPVTDIGGYAFSWCHNLTSVTIPDSIISIGEGAFDHCDRLTSVTIGDGVITIGKRAFYFCENLASVTIGKGVTSIGDEAFQGCSSLIDITIPGSIASIGYDAFTYCYDLNYNIFGKGKYLGNDANPYVVLVDVITKELQSYEIHPDTKIIYEYAFYECYNLTDITIPDSVTAIYGFNGCTSLPSITIPDSVTTLGGFYRCTALTSITIPDSVTTLGGFGGCTALTSITIPDSVTTLSGFYGCTNLTSVTIPNGVTRIDTGAFAECYSLSSVAIPASLTYIDYTAFENCNNLEIVVFCGTLEQLKNVGAYITGNQSFQNAEFRLHNYENGVCTYCHAAEVCEHDWADATCVAPKTCKLCQATEGEALGHNMQQTADEIAPTCEVAGKTAVLTCANGCGHTEGGEEIPAIGHNMQETEAAVEPTCTAVGKTAVLTCANGCGHTEGGEEIPAKGHSFENDTCTVCGQGKYVAGDGNGDGKINLRDAILVLQASNGKDVAVDQGAADVTGDGKMNIRDAILILKRANGNKDPFPVEK